MRTLPVPSGGMILSYAGDFTSETALSLRILAEKSLILREEAIHIRRKILNISTELLQNIARHADRLTTPSRSAVFQLKLNPAGYSICSGNSVTQNNIIRLKAALDHINSLNVAALKELYQKRLRRSLAPGQKGPGLGWIDLARRSGGQVEYQFDNINSAGSFLWLNINVQRNQS